MNKRILPSVILITFMGVPSAWSVTLQQAWQAAKQHAATYHAADYARDAAQELPVQAKSRLLPQLEASANHKRFSSDHDAYTQGIQIQVSQPLFNRTSWGEYKAAQFSAKQAEQVFQDKESRLLLDVGKAYLGILTARDKLKAVRAEQAAYTRQIEQAKALFQSGEATILDTYEAEAGLDAAKAKALNLETERLLAENQFTDLTGLAPDTITAITADPLPDLSKGSSEADWIAKAMRHSAALQARQMAVEKSLSDVAVAEGEHWPQLSLTAGYQDNRTYRHGDTQRDKGAYIGVSFTIPIYTGGQTSSKVRQSKAVAAQRIAEQESERDRIRLAVKQAWAMLNGQRAQIKAQKRLLKSNAAKLKATRLGRTYGVRHSMDEIQAEQAYAEAQEKLAEARYGYIEAWLTLLYSSGELGNSPDISGIYHN